MEIGNSILREGEPVIHICIITVDFRSSYFYSCVRKHKLNVLCVCIVYWCSDTVQIQIQNFPCSEEGEASIQYINEHYNSSK